jgi:hypothetical protein
MPASWSSAQLFNFNFHQVAGTIFRKYPNEYAEHVVSVDVLERSIDPETGVLRTERLIGVNQPAPRWVTTVSLFSASSFAESTMLITSIF